MRRTRGAAIAVAIIITAAAADLLPVLDHLQGHSLGLERGGQDHVQRQPQRRLLHLDRGDLLLFRLTVFIADNTFFDNPRLQGLAELFRRADDEAEASPHALLADRRGKSFPGRQPSGVVRGLHGEHVVVSTPEGEDVERHPVHGGLGQTPPAEDGRHEPRVCDDDKLLERQGDSVEGAVLVGEALPEPVDLRATPGHGGELEGVAEEGERARAGEGGPGFEVACFC